MVSRCIYYINTLWIMPQYKDIKRHENNEDNMKLSCDDREE